MPSQSLSQLESLFEQTGLNPFLGVPVPLNSESLQVFADQVCSLKNQKGVHLLVEEAGADLKGALLLEALPFDSELYGFPMARITFLAALGNYHEQNKVQHHLLEQAFELCRKEGIRHLSARALPDELSLIHALEKSGFYMVSGLSTFLLNLKQFSYQKPTVLIRPFKKEDLEPLCTMSRLSFGNPKDWLDKAHADPNLPKDKSDELYVRWFRNCCNGTRADQVLVAEVEGKPAGYIALKLEKGLYEKVGWRVGNVPLNAVDPSYRKMGIYAALVQEGLKWFSGKVDWATIKTQVTTLAVHKTWQKLGAHMSSVEYAFHKFFK